jgi:hypothetical protein
MSKTPPDDFEFVLQLFDAVFQLFRHDVPFTIFAGYAFLILFFLNKARAKKVPVNPKQAKGSQSPARTYKVRSR